MIAVSVARGPSLLAFGSALCCFTKLASSKIKFSQRYLGYEWKLWIDSSPEHHDGWIPVAFPYVGLRGEIKCGQALDSTQPTVLLG